MPKAQPPENKYHGEMDPFVCPGCHTGDFADFDHYCDVLGISMDDTPEAFAKWLAGKTGKEVEYGQVKPAEES